MKSIVSQYCRLISRWSRSISASSVYDFVLQFFLSHNIHLFPVNHVATAIHHRPPSTSSLLLRLQHRYERVPQRRLSAVVRRTRPTSTAILRRPSRQILHGPCTFLGGPVRKRGSLEQQETTAGVCLFLLVVEVDSQRGDCRPPGRVRVERRLGHQFDYNHLPVSHLDRGNLQQCGRRPISIFDGAGSCGNDDRQRRWDPGSDSVITVSSSGQ
jgi:hypothetical protein